MKRKRATTQLPACNTAPRGKGQRARTRRYESRRVLAAIQPRSRLDSGHSRLDYDHKQMKPTVNKCTRCRARG